MVSEKKFYAREARSWTRMQIYKRIVCTIQDIGFYDEDYKTGRPGLVMFPVKKLSAATCQWFVDREFEISREPIIWDHKIASLSRQVYKIVCRRWNIKIDKSYDINFAD